MIIVFVVDGGVILFARVTPCAYAPSLAGCYLTRRRRAQVWLQIRDPFYESQADSVVVSGLTLVATLFNHVSNDSLLSPFYIVAISA